MSFFNSSVLRHLLLLAFDFRGLLLLLARIGNLVVERHIGARCGLIDIAEVDHQAAFGRSHLLLVELHQQKQQHQHNEIEQRGHAADHASGRPILLLLIKVDHRYGV